MVDSFTPSLRIVQMPTGSNDRLWGTKANAAFTAFEQAIAGSESISVTAGNVTLTEDDNAPDQSRNAILNFTGTPGTTRTVTVPDVSKLTLVINSSNGNVILDAGAGLAATLQPGQVAFVFTPGDTNAYAFLLTDVPGHSALSQIFAHESL